MTSTEPVAHWIDGLATAPPDEETVEALAGAEQGARIIRDTGVSASSTE